MRVALLTVLLGFSLASVCLARGARSKATVSTSATEPRGATMGTSVVGDARAIGSPCDAGLTISASDVDPFVNSGPPSANLTTVYVWLYCAKEGTGGLSRVAFLFDPPGMVMSDFSFVAEPGVVVVEAANGFIDLTTANCPRGTALLGAVTYRVSGPAACHIPRFLLPFAGVEYCSDPGALHEFAYVGYGAGTDTCLEGFGFWENSCVPVMSVESATWGRVKGMYR